MLSSAHNAHLVGRLAQGLPHQHRLAGLEAWRRGLRDDTNAPRACVRVEAGS